MECMKSKELVRLSISCFGSSPSLQRGNLKIVGKRERRIEPGSSPDRPVCFDRRQYRISNSHEKCGECLWEPVNKCYLVSLQTDNGVSHQLRGAPGHRRCHSEGLAERLVNKFPFEPRPSSLDLLSEDLTYPVLFQAIRMLSLLAQGDQDSCAVFILKEIRVENTAPLMWPLLCVAQEKGCLTLRGSFARHISLHL